MITRFKEFFEDYNKNGVENLIFEEPKDVSIKSKRKIFKCASSAIIEFDLKVDLPTQKLKKIYFSWS